MVTESEPLLTTSEICDRYQVSRRALSKWIRKGLPRHTVDGQRGNHFCPREINAFLANQRGGMDRIAAAMESAPLPEAAEPERRTLTLDTPIDTLTEMLERLRVAEKVTYGQWARAVKQQRAGTELIILERAWHECVEKRRRLEKDLPELMAKKALYVDIRDVEPVITRAATELSSQLNGLGTAVAEQCVGQSADVIRCIVNQAVNAMKRQLVAAWEPWVNDEVQL